ncbi:MAG: histidinol-phosphate aminotransferase 2 [Candidatus Binatia bacterium]|nr:MAG: histidinol-phosphate aminotransferase 2 [Candidatus Binatia bacterium]
MTVDFASLVPSWVRSLEPYSPGMPIEELERRYGIRDSIKLASNENPLGPSPRALEAVRESLGELHRYPEGDAFVLRRKLAARLGVSPEALVFGHGSNEVLELVVRAFLSPGEEAVVAEGTFLIYRLIVQAAGGRVRSVPLREFTHDLEGMAEAVGKGTKLVFVANPNNPTGTIVRREEWRRFLEKLPGHVVVVVDEAYGEYVEDPEFPDALAATREKPVLVLRTFSKIYGLAGLRLGYGVGPPGLVEFLERVRQPFNVGTLAQVAAAAALEDHEHVERSKRLNREGMCRLAEGFRRLGLFWVPSQANFVLVRVGDGARIYERLLRRGVIVRPMAAYGFPEFVRVTVGVPEENERLLRSLEEVLREGGNDGSGG